MNRCICASAKKYKLVREEQWISAEERNGNGEILFSGCDGIVSGLSARNGESASLSICNREPGTISDASK
jgi:hypothetical protein